MSVAETTHGLCSDTCQTTSNDGSPNITVKVEEGLKAAVVEGPEPISFPDIKTESEVSCLSVFSLFFLLSQLYNF
jgi:hypothetical protein